MIKNPKVDTYINKNQKKGLVIKSQKKYQIKYYS